MNKKILIYRLGSLGDTIIALPCFHLIREKYPNSNITLLTNKPVMAKAAPLEAVLGNDFFYDQILNYPVGTRNPNILLKLLKQIKSLNIDTVINITATRSRKSDLRDKLFFKLAGIKDFIGFDNTDIDYTVAIDPKTGFYEWEAKRLARKINKLGEIQFDNEKYWDLRLTHSEKQNAENLLGDFNTEKKLFAVNCGTKMPVKDWGAENWLQLIVLLKDKLPDWNLIIIGVDEEFELAEQLLQEWSRKGLNLCGKSSPRVSAAILKYCKFFIGHDSGPMHLAACVGIPCVGIFSGINQPKQWFPKGENNRILYPEKQCENCNSNLCISEKNKCILTIKPEEVKNAVLEIANPMELNVL